ncbi:aspartate/glutamate racemase family protein [Nocardia sp. alder85J]|uniref:maleate cis-trans isomerase family protein n=1 Tax=Nocardia sp. alder85J TaxID=2862949 RepID=UPI001CD35623|nr:aspartate/glutamate racemase family protein [Nocardia sp. alder85J]MCX4091428.1 aspartate/glutamate racemase family protein [Nocardia sp. alder85J]
MTGDGRPLRLGMIVPSSNTCLEPMTYRMLAERTDVTVHATRVPVTRIALDESSDRQFDLATMCHAAELLATADVDLIAWNGTAGSWLGAGHDRAMVAGIEAATGIPATTSTLAYAAAYREFGITSIGLLTPYTDDVNTRITACCAEAGVTVTAAHALGLSDNESFARITPAELLPPSRRLAATDPAALVYLCTNMYGAPIVDRVEAETGVPALDSVAVTLWWCLRLLGAAPLAPRWGSLLARQPDRSA